MAAASSCPNSKDTVLALLSREIRFDSVQSQRIQREKRKQRSSSSPGGTLTEISEEHRDLASEWMHEVVIDSAVKLDVFLLSVTIMDSFLDVCPILTNQVQLLASACLLLADKVKTEKDNFAGKDGGRDTKNSTARQILSETQIIEYTDNSITHHELKAWEMLVLSKLDWDVNFVIALDYLEPLNSLLSSDLPPKAETNELQNLICTLSKRYATFRAIYSARLVACSALNFSEKTEILQLLNIASQDSKVLLKQCSREFYPTCKTPPNQLSSPFKAESTSTPKSSRTPLRDNNVNLNEMNTSSPIRRRLTSLCGGEESKENNDSGYPLLSTSVESKSPAPSSTSKTSSQQSSPDSGASSGASPKNNKDVQELDKLLESTHINSQ